MIPLDDLRAAAVPFALRLRSPFRGLTVREGMLIKGPHGWGEFAPFDDYSPRAASRWLASAVEAAFGDWPEPLRESIPVNAIVPAVDADDAAVLAREAVLERGCTTVKVKVGSGLADDEARVAAVRDVLDATLGRGRGVIRIDANAAWDAATAVRCLRRLRAYALEYVEQPCPTVAELQQVRREVDVPIAADELIRHADDPGSVPVREFADVAILKAAPLGGAQALLDVAERLAVPVVVSGSLDSAVGLDSGVMAAAALPELGLACGLGTGGLLVDDVVDEPRVPVDGRIAVGRTAPDLGSLLAARDRLAPQRVEYWHERLTAAWQAGMEG